MDPVDQAYRQGVEDTIKALQKAKQLILDEEEYWGAEGVTDLLIATALDVLGEEGLYEE